MAEREAPSLKAAEKPPADGSGAKRDSTPDHVKKIGVLLVHGIGEQRRFEHLEGEVRNIAAAMQAVGDVMTVRVVVHTSPTAAYAAEQQTWRAEDVAPVMIEVTEKTAEVTEIHFREVWWADLDEPATLRTQIKFWCWGLSMWADPGKPRSTLSGYTLMRPPTTADQAQPRIRWWGRIRLFVVGMAFWLILMTVSLANLLLRRFPTLHIPGPEILVRYIGDVKLFVQEFRIGKGPLVDIGQPPRVTLRRRMIRALVYMALEDYHRWYVLAHSQGTVLAFNGLMETKHALPNYIDQGLWDKCKNKFRAKTTEPLTTEQVGNMMPSRPAWLEPDDIIDRKSFFGGLKGFMTYGSPLEKFAVLWPAIVPLNRDETVFGDNFEWVNVYDATDPVSGPLKSFNPLESLGPAPRNVSYKAKSAHLLSHIGYLAFKPGQDKRMVNALAEWLLRGRNFSVPEGGTWRWPDTYKTALYATLRYAIWVIGILVLAAILGRWFGEAIRLILPAFPDILCGRPGGCVLIYDGLIQALLDTPPVSWVFDLLESWLPRRWMTETGLHVFAAFIVVLFVGLGRLWTARKR